jgi:hypothetical protein
MRRPAMIEAALILPGTGRGTKARSGLVEGRWTWASRFWLTPLHHPRSAGTVPLPPLRAGRI